MCGLTAARSRFLMSCTKHGLHACPKNAAKGTCGAGHSAGDQFNLSCWDTGGLCGFFYHDIFPNLNVMQFGGKCPWGSADEMVLEYPYP